MPQIPLHPVSPHSGFAAAGVDSSSLATKETANVSGWSSFDHHRVSFEPHAASVKLALLPIVCPDL
jgi:hypothetical protein